MALAKYVKRSLSVPAEVAAGVKALATAEDVSEAAIYRRVLREGWKKLAALPPGGLLKPVRETK